MVFGSSWARRPGFVLTLAKEVLARGGRIVATVRNVSTVALSVEFPKP